MPKPARRRVKLPAAARAASVEKHVGELRSRIHRFLILKANAIATTAEELYARATKSDEDKIRRIPDELGLDDWDDLADLVKTALVAAFEEGGASALKALDLAEPGFFDRLNTEALAYAKERGAELVGMKWVNGELVPNPRAEWSVSESTRDGLRDLIAKAFDEGLSPSQLADAIRDAYEFSEARADMIARTELAFAHTQGELDSMRASGAVTGKSLLLSDGHDIDDECNEAADEGVVDLDADIDPPLHPNCLVGGTVVSASGVAAQYSRWIDGEVIRLLIEGPNQLTVTPNHPVLTRRGWVAAGALQKGDDLIACSDPGLAVSILNPDDHHVETAIEEIGRALLVAGGVASRGVPLTSEDFHGDSALGENVDVVRAARDLEARQESTVSQLPSHELLAAAHHGKSVEGQLSREGLFSGGRATAQFLERQTLAADGSVGGLGSSHSLGGRHPASLDSVGLALRADAEAKSPERLPDRDVVDARVSRQVDARFPGQVSAMQPQDLLVGEQDPLLGRDRAGGSRIPPVNAVSSEGPVDGLRMATQILGDLDDRLPALVKTLKLLDLFRESFSGHVYNLSTECGWYTASGIITHNCECTLVYEVAEQEEEVA